jgi:hypothetical protein
MPNGTMLEGTHHAGFDFTAMRRPSPYGIAAAICMTTCLFAHEAFEAAMREFALRQALIALDTAKIHTLITLAIHLRAKLLVSSSGGAPSVWVRFHIAHSTLRLASGRVGTRDWGQYADPVGKRWEPTSIWRWSRAVDARDYRRPINTSTIKITTMTPTLPLGP